VKTLADLKRTLTAGTVVIVSEHIYPELEGERTVLKAQTQRMSMSLPDGHPRKAEVPNGSWLDFPKASRVRFENGSAIILNHDGTQLCRITVKQ
jgi:hypothetical protein